MMLTVLEIGLQASIQDAGRKGYRRVGVPASGFMDPFAGRVANLLVGNPEGSALIETMMGSISVQSDVDCLVAACGVGYELTVRGESFPLWMTVLARAGERVSLDNRGGAWGYLAVSGGLAAGLALGSRSTFTGGGTSAFGGKILAAGDCLPTGSPAGEWRMRAGECLEMNLDEFYDPGRPVGVIPGPHRDDFSLESLDRFVASPYVILPVSNRMGYRLQGEALVRKEPREVLSMGMLPGCIQVPASGQPIVLLADAPASGGYPMAGCVCQVDLPALVQRLPGESEVCFTWQPVEDSQRAFTRLWRQVRMELSMD